MSSERKDLYTCPNCYNHLDDCNCACPYCGEIVDCNCAIGHGVATGG